MSKYKLFQYAVIEKQIEGEEDKEPRLLLEPTCIFAFSMEDAAERILKQMPHAIQLLSYDIILNEFGK